MTVYASNLAWNYMKTVHNTRLKICPYSGLFHARIRAASRIISQAILRNLEILENKED